MKKKNELESSWKGIESVGGLHDGGGKSKTEREGCQHEKLKQHEPNMEQRQRWRDRGWWRREKKAKHPAERMVGLLVVCEADETF